MGVTEDAPVFRTPHSPEDFPMPEPAPSPAPERKPSEPPSDAPPSGPGAVTPRPPEEGAIFRALVDAGAEAMVAEQPVDRVT